MDETVYRGVPDQHYDHYPLPPQPQYFQEYTSFVTNLDSKSLRTSLQTTFVSQNVDFVLSSSKATFGGIYRNQSGQDCSFKVNLFRTAENQVLVEFQRASGDAVAFNAIYHITASQLGSSVRHVVRTDGKNGFQLHDIPDELKLVLDGPSLKALYSVVLSSQESQVADSLRTLAHISEDHENAAFMLNSLTTDGKCPALTEVITCVLTSGNVKIYRYASIMLANLVSHPNSASLQQWLLSHCTQPLLSLLAGSEQKGSSKSIDFSPLLTRETRRRAARIFAVLSSLSPEQLLNCKPTLSLYSGDSDQETKTYIQQALSAC